MSDRLGISKFKDFRCRAKLGRTTVRMLRENLTPVKQAPTRPGAQYRLPNKTGTFPHLPMRMRLGGGRRVALMLEDDALSVVRARHRVHGDVSPGVMSVAGHDLLRKDLRSSVSDPVIGPVIARTWRAEPCSVPSRCRFMETGMESTPLLCSIFRSVLQGTELGTEMSL